MLRFYAFVKARFYAFVKAKHEIQVAQVGAMSDGRGHQDGDEMLQQGRHVQPRARRVVVWFEAWAEGVDRADF